MIAFLDDLIEVLCAAWLLMAFIAHDSFKNEGKEYLCLV